MIDEDVIFDPLIPTRDLYVCDWCLKPRPEIKIRELATEDFHNGFFEALNALSPTEFKSPDQAFHFYALRLDRGVRTYVATRDDAIVGTASLLLEPKFIHGGTWVGHLEDVAVTNQWQGHGIGRILVNHIVEECVKAKCYKIILDCEEELIPFYEKCGFRRDGSLMRKNLT